MMRNKIRGFTLIELMVVVAIVGLLATISYPTYVEYVAKSNRTEGQRELLRIANLMEQRFLDTRIYTPNLLLLGLNADPYITTERGGGGHYSISAAIANNGTTFTLTAVALGHQASIDSACATLTVNETGARTPAATTGCWER